MINEEDSSEIQILINRLEPLWSDNPVWRSPTIGPGWVPLVLSLIDELEKTQKKFEVVQVKEKLGGLRFYIDGDNDLCKIIHSFEEQSFHICEVCGEAGEVRDLPWVTTLCQEHLEFFQSKTKETDET